MPRQSRTYSHRFILFGILVLASFIRLWYIHYSGNTIVLKPDSQGYYVEENFFGKNFLTNLINPNRTPGYTLLTSLAVGATGDTYPPYKSQEFIERSFILIPIQTIIGIVSLIFLFDMLMTVGVSSSHTAAFTGFTALNIYQFIWDRALLTESLYISLFTVLLWLFVKLLQRPSAPTAALFTILAGYEFLIRPAGLLIPFLLLPIVFWAHRTKRVFILMAASLILYSAVPAGLLVGNRLLHGFRGISYNTDFAVFGRILLFDIPVDAAARVQPLFTQVTEYRQKGGNVSIPWYFFVYYNNEIYGRLDSLQEFNRLVIRDQFPAFAASVIEDVPKAFSDTEMYGVLYRAATPSLARAVFDTFEWIVRTIQKSTIIFLFLAPFSVWLFLKRPTPIHSFLFAIALIEGYQLVSSLIFGGAWEFARHMITTQTFLFFFHFWWIARILSRIYKR